MAAAACDRRYSNLEMAGLMFIMEVALELLAPRLGPNRATPLPPG